MNLSLVNKEFRALLFRESYTFVSITGKAAASKMISLLRLVRWNDIIRKSIRDFHLHIEEFENSRETVQEADIMFLEQTAASLGIAINKRLGFLTMHTIFMHGRPFTIHEACKKGSVPFTFMASILLLMHLQRMEELFLEVSEPHIRFIGNFCGLIEGIRFPVLQSLALRGTRRGVGHDLDESEPSVISHEALKNLFIAAPKLDDLFLQRYHLLGRVGASRNTQIRSLVLHGVYAQLAELPSTIEACEMLETFIHIKSMHEIEDDYLEIHPGDSCLAFAFASRNRASSLQTVVLDFRPNDGQDPFSRRVSSFEDFTQLRSLWISMNSLDNSAYPIRNLPASLERLHLAGLSWELAEDLLWLADQIEWGNFPRLREVCIDGEGCDITNIINRFRECGIHADSKIDNPITW
ncbi:hypothetical protein RB213_008805 [Colletotrichum asianum]